MKTEPNENHAFERRPRGGKTVLLGLAFLMMGSALAAGSVIASDTSFNNVQIFVTTSAQLPYSYSFSAYNLTGSLVASYQGSYPAAAFELPTGDYLFTVSAVYQNYYPCYQCVYASGGTTAGPEKSLAPFRYFPPTSEYGFLQAHIDTAQTLNIQTKNVTEFPTTDVTVKVSFVNGTAASGAWVSASVVGQWYYWWGQDSGVMMSAQTGADGIANLVLPVAPAVVTAWDWVPVNLPNNETTIVVNVGGESVNVTVYWQPTYVGLSASSLLIPPAHSANLVLRYQEPNYWYFPMGVGYQTAPPDKGGAIFANQPSGVPAQVSQANNASTQTGQAQYYLPSQIPPLQQSGPSGPSAPAAAGATFLPWMVAVVAVGLFAALGVALVVQGRKQRPPEAAV